MQASRTRWFTDAYVETLKGARAVLEFSKSNLPYLNDKLGPAGSRHLNYVPAYCHFDSSWITPVPSSKKTIDILFYGDFTSERRKRMLQTVKTKLGRKYVVRTVMEVFGKEMARIIQQVCVYVL